MTTASGQARQIGRYVLFEAMASGGMATVHYGRLVGPAGFSRTVAIKRLHETFAMDPEFVSMFLDEARIAARVSHPNVVSTLDVVTTMGEVLLVMEYVQGDALSHVLRVLRSGNGAVPPPIAAGIACQTLLGLHAAHEARGEDGSLLGVVHRDVSPQNILVGVDGIVRVADFGVAKAVGRMQTTREGQIKGKSAYMAPEQIRGRDVDRSADIFSASVVLWEALTGQRLFSGDTPIGVMREVLEKEIPLVAQTRSAIPKEFDAIVARGLARNPSERFATARDMAVVIEESVPVASSRAIGEWVVSIASDVLTARAQRVAEIESGSVVEVPVPIPTPDAVADSVHTGTNHVTEATPSVRPRPRRRGTMALAVGGVAVLLLAALTRVMHRQPASPPMPAASDSAPAAGLDVAPLASASAAAIAVPAVSASSSATPPAGVSPVTTHPGRPGRPQGTRNSSVNCNPPYTTDASGVRHWKDGC